MKSVLFRIPDEIRNRFNIEIVWSNSNGQKFIEGLIYKHLHGASKVFVSEKNDRGETRDSVGRRLQIDCRDNEISDKAKASKKSFPRRKGLNRLGRGYIKE